MQLGGSTSLYSDTQVCAIFNTPAGQGQNQVALIALEHQLIAAKLNLANGTPNACIAAAIAQADALIAQYGSSLTPAQASGLITTLNSYNNGTFQCAGLCPADN
jgi:hypothetical protein